VIPESYDAGVLAPGYDKGILFSWDANQDTPAWTPVSAGAMTRKMAETFNGAVPGGSMYLAQSYDGGPPLLKGMGPLPDLSAFQMPLAASGYAGVGDAVGFVGAYTDLATLQAAFPMEPYGAVWGYAAMAFLLDTQSWWQYVEGDDQGTSTSGADPSTNIAGGTDCKFKISVDGDAAEEVTLTLTGLTSGALIAAAMQRAIRALGGLKLFTAVSFASGLYVFTSASYRPESAIVITNGDTLNVADNLKIGLANGGTETTGSNGGWTKVPSSAWRGSFANVAALPTAADDNDTALVLDDGAAHPAIYRYDSGWAKVGNLT
jgi:hypothetical protein